MSVPARDERLPFRRLCVVAPHPDDETLAVGGLIHRAWREDIPVQVILCVVPGEFRMAEYQDAALGLGVSETTVLHNTGPERSASRDYLDTMPEAELIDLIDENIQRFEPDAVVLPPPFGYHQEHRVVSAATLAALRPSAGTSRGPVPFVACYEHAADHWGPQPAPQPTFYVRLSEDDVDAKHRALKAYSTQMREAPSERSWWALEAHLRMRGVQAGTNWAEALELRRWLL